MSSLEEVDTLMEDISPDELSELRSRIQEQNNQCHSSKLVCECKCVSTQDLQQILKDHGYLDLEIAQKLLGLGTGCSSCITDFNNYLQSLNL